MNVVAFRTYMKALSLGEREQKTNLLSYSGLRPRPGVWQEHEEHQLSEPWDLVPT